MDKKMLDALTEQVNKEFFSAYLYLAMASDFESKNLMGFANWMKVQYQEETFHAMKLYDYINERGEKAILKAIEEPQASWETPLAAFEAAYAHEQYITKSINELVHLAREVKDVATEIFLEWYVTEQVEEEASVDSVVQELEFVEGHPHAVFMIDRELKQRVFTPPAAE